MLQRKHDEREVRLKRLTSNIAESFAKKQEPGEFIIDIHVYYWLIKLHKYQIK